MDEGFTYHQVKLKLSFYFSQCYSFVHPLSLSLSDRYTVMGVKINTPHYLAKLENLPAGSHTYTVIVSQLDSLSTIYYTIRVCKTTLIL